MSAAGFAHRGSGGRNLPAFNKTSVVLQDRTVPDTDSNAVVSSEDEHEITKSVESLTSQTGRPAPSQGTRRSSFLNELQTNPKRRMSITAPSNGSQPPTPSVDSSTNPWSFGSGLARVASNGSATSWNAGQSIWSNSGAAIGQPLAPVRSHGDAYYKPSSPLDDIIPFSIPLHPTPKTYRSNSYSVGQMEAELSNNAGRNRGNVASVKHKPSRLNEVEHAPTLDEVHEGDDEGSDAGVPLGSPQFYNATTFPGYTGTQPGVQPGEYGLTRSITVPYTDGSTDYGLTRSATLSYIDESNVSPTGDNDLSRAEALPAVDENEPQTLGSRLGLQNIINTRTHWQTAHHAVDQSFSRRHSLADVPTRRGSLVAEARPFGHALDSHQSHTAELEDSMVQSDAHNRAYAQTYFSGTAPALRSHVESTQNPADFANSRSEHQYRQGPPPAIFNRPGFDTPLYIVAFKCARADIYYVQPSTGLEVNEGDLVMVEADRGYDLGTVTHAGISWAKARELKEKALDEHFRWLMMFSSHNQELAAADPTAAHGLMAQRGPQERDPYKKARDGMHGQSNESAYTHDIKPRMIKRRAFNHEIANLREKEGNEAKAKRACQQKAREHGCHMEILDAEFQIDWKKLTFYFYAPDYVNFNPLVTDLYKVYKVRIWMSAINPGTYPSPVNKPPSSIGPGAMEGRDTPLEQGAASFNDPDPHGALPPTFNPASDTYKMLRAADLANAQGNGSAPAPSNGDHWNSEHELSLEWMKERFEADRKKMEFHTAEQWAVQQRIQEAEQAIRHAEHNRQQAGQAAARQSNGSSGVWGNNNYPFHRQTPTQAGAGAEFNSASRPPPAPPGFYVGGGLPPPGASPSPGYQAWNGFTNSGAEQRPSRGLNPLSPSVNFGGDWTRGFGNLNLNPNGNKKK